MNAALILPRRPAEPGLLADQLRARLDCREVLVGVLAAVIGVFACPA